MFEIRAGPNQKCPNEHYAGGNEKKTREGEPQVDVTVTFIPSVPRQKREGKTNTTAEEFTKRKNREKIKLKGERERRGTGGVYCQKGSSAGGVKRRGERLIDRRSLLGQLDPLLSSGRGARLTKEKGGENRAERRLMT